MSQTLDGTTIALDYGRPALRGRSGMFGNQVKWGHVWTPGANMATTIDINTDIIMEGVDIPAGKYSMWMVVSEHDWEVILSPEWKLFHVPEPKRADDQITFMITPNIQSPETETLTFDFPVNAGLSTTLRMRWDQTAVNLAIEVPSQLH